MFPAMAWSMSWSVGVLFWASSAAADMSCPDWQKPHWGTSSCIQARWTGWSVLADSPSMVVTRFPATADTGVTQARVGVPSTWTVQAPQSAMPQPYFVPVSSSVSRSAQRSGISGATSTCRGVPFTVRAIMRSPLDL